jgi:hypothetical protein
LASPFGPTAAEVLEKRLTLSGPTAVQITPPDANVSTNQKLVLTATFTDNDANPAVTDTWTVAGPDGTTTNTTGTPSIVNGQGTDQLKLKEATAGTYTVTLTAADATGQTGTGSTVVFVADGTNGNGNVSPAGSGTTTGLAATSSSGSGSTASGPSAVAITPSTISITSVQTLLLRASFTDTDTSPSLTSTWTVIGPSGVGSQFIQTPTVVAGQGSDSFRFTPQGVGNYTVNVIIRDNWINVTGSATATVLVVAPAGPSALTLTPATSSIAANQSVFLSAAFADPDPHALVVDTWTITFPDGSVFSDQTTTDPVIFAGQGTDGFRFVPSYFGGAGAYTGTYKVSLTVRDEETGASSSASSTITVTAATGSGPSSAWISPIPAHIAVGQQFFIGSGFLDFDSAPSLTATWTLTGPNGTTTSVDQPQILGGFGNDSLQEQLAAGNYSIQYTVADTHTGASRSASASFVVGSRSSPTIGLGLGPNETILTGQSLDLAAQIADNDSGAQLTDTWIVTSPTGTQAQVQPPRPAWSDDFLFAPTQTGTYTVKIASTDDLGQTAYSTTQITVVPRQLTVVLSPGNVMVALGQSGGETAIITDPNPTPALSDHWTVVAPDGTVSGGPGSPSSSGLDAFGFTASQTGTYFIAVAVTDANTGVSGSAHASVFVTGVGSGGGSTSGSGSGSTSGSGSGSTSGSGSGSTSGSGSGSTSGSGSGSTSGSGSGSTSGSGTTNLPTVTALSSSNGPLAGGGTLTITGSGFTGATAVKFGTAAQNLSVVSDTKITVTIPAASSASTVDVTVTTPAGTSLPTLADKYTYQAPASPPTVSSLSPSGGPTTGGGRLTITGTNFNGATGVKFGTVPATQFSVLSSTQITVTIPAVSSPTTVDVTVTTPVGTSAANAGDKYTYQAVQAPTITSLSPTSGSTAGGTLVQINGSNLSGVTAVSFGGTPAMQFTPISPTLVTAIAPAHLAGVVDVRVTTAGGTSALSAADQFTFKVAAPVVTGLSPSSGSTDGGTSITISGLNFQNVTGVLFGSTSVPYTLVSPTVITVTTPAHVAGTVDVVVQAAAGNSSLSPADQFTFRVPAPVITGISPTSGPVSGGTAVTITGTDLNGATSVLFGQTPATSFNVVSPTTITAVAPAGVVGPVNVVVATPGGYSAIGPSDVFTYKLKGPNGLSITPSTSNVQSGQSATLSAAFVDLDASPTLTDTWTVTGPTNSTVTHAPTMAMTAGSDQFQFTPVQTGTYTISLKVADNAGNSTSGSATITVAAAGGGGGGTGLPSGNALTVALTPATTTLPAYHPDLISATISDPDQTATVTDTWTVSLWGGFPYSTTSHPTGGAGSWSDSYSPPPSLFTGGVYTVTLTASDNKGHSGSASTIIDVYEGITGVFVTPASNTILAGQSVLLTAQFVDSYPGDLLSDSWSGLGINGTISQTPLVSGGIGTDQFLYTPPSSMAGQGPFAVGVKLTDQTTAQVYYSNVSITVLPQPKAKIQIDGGIISSFQAGEIGGVRLNASLNGDFGANTVAQWSVSGPGGYSTTAQGLSFTLPSGSAAGGYSATLTVSGANGQATDRASFSLGPNSLANPVVTATSPTSVIYEGQSVTLRASYDPTKPWSNGTSGGPATNSSGPFTYAWQVTDPRGAAVAGQLNSDGSFTFTPGYAGTFSATATITGPAGSGVNVVSGLQSINVLTPKLTATGGALFGIEGKDVSGVVANFIELATGSSGSAPGFPPSLAATINWGDGSTSAGQIANGTVSGDHAYEKQGPYVISVEIVDNAEKLVGYAYSPSTGFTHPLIPVVTVTAGFAEIFGPGDEAFADALNSETSSATISSESADSLDARSWGFPLGSPYAQSANFGQLGSGSGSFNFNYAFTERDGSGSFTDTGTLSVAFQAAGAYDAMGGSTPQFEAISNISVNMQDQETRQETFVDPFLTLTRTQSLSGTTVETHVDTLAIGFSWTRRREESGTETASGVILAQVPTGGFVPGELDEFVQKIDDVGIGGPFSYAGQETLLEDASGHENFSTGATGEFDNRTSLLAATQSGTNQTRSYTQTIFNIDSNTHNDSFFVPNSGDWSGGYAQSSIHRVETNGAQTITTDQFTPVFEGTKQGSDPQTGDYTNFSSSDTQTHTRTTETNQTDTTTENSVSEEIGASQEFGNSNSGVYARVQQNTNFATAFTNETNQTSTVSAVET